MQISKISLAIHNIQMLNMSLKKNLYVNHYLFQLVHKLNVSTKPYKSSKYLFQV